MIPRIFVSSTYYDLRHVRERLEKFIDRYGFEPILFESDKVTYQHGKEIDHSAYFEVGLCHIMILIIGGRYGSPSSLTDAEEERKKYDEDYILITRKEFETAFLKNIPILIFVDRSVYSEYQTYKENQEIFDEIYSTKSTKETKDFKKFKFAHVDHVNVFKFIDSVKTKPIKTFEKVEEIENYIKIQLSGMFYLYLESLKSASEDNEIFDKISELNNVTLRMNEMLNSVGKEILGKDKKEYEKVIEKQFEIMLDFFLDKFGQYFTFDRNLPEEEIEQIDLEKAARVIYEKALRCSIPKIEKSAKSSDWVNKYHEVNNIVMADVQLDLLNISEDLVIEKFEFRSLNRDLTEKILQFIHNKKDEDRLIEGLKKVLGYKLGMLPF